MLPFIWLRGLIREAVSLEDGESRDKVVIIFIVQNVDNERTV